MMWGEVLGACLRMLTGGGDKLFVVGVHAVLAVARAYPRLALLVHLHLTVPEPGSHDKTSSTMEPSAQRICEPGCTSTGSFL